MKDKKQKVQIHYYFYDDTSHSMDALVRNNAEREILKAIQRISEILGVELQIETEAYQKGSLIEVIAILGVGGVLLKPLMPAINNILTHYLTKSSEERKLDLEIKKEQLQALRIDNLIKLNLLKDKQIDVLISNYYDKINNYNKIKKIGFRNSNENQEYIVERKDFAKFILEEHKETEEVDAQITIISPILTKQRYKWKGLYNSYAIDFSMADKTFQDNVAQGKYNFSNGTTIDCRLEIKTTYDEDGEIKNVSYSVKEVYDVIQIPQNMIEKLPQKRKKRKKKEGEYVRDLFDFNDIEND